MLDKNRIDRMIDFLEKIQETFIALWLIMMLIYFVFYIMKNL